MIVAGYSGVGKGGLFYYLKWGHLWGHMGAPEGHPLLDNLR